MENENLYVFNKILLGDDIDDIQFK